MEDTKRRWTKCNNNYSKEELVDKLERITPPQNNEEAGKKNLHVSYNCAEVEKGVKRAKKNETARTDVMTAEMIQEGGERITKTIYKLCR